jgi:hypothetical protein
VSLGPVSWRATAVAVPALVISLTLAAPSRAATAPGQPVQPFSYLRNYTDQLGYPGFDGGTAVTAQSDLYTGSAELSLGVGAARKPLPSTRALDEGRYPILSSTASVQSVRYTQTAFAAPVGGSQVNFVRVAAFNPTDRPRAARITAFVRNSGAGLVGQDGRVCRSYRFRRPEIPPRTGLYSQPGLEFSPFSTYAFSGRALLRDGTVIYDFPRPPAPLRLTRSMRVDTRPIDSRTIFGQTEYAGKLAPHQQVVVDFRMPVDPVPPAGAAYRAITHASFSAYRRRTRASWARFLGGAMRLDLPEPKVVDTFYTSLVNILMPRYRVGGGDWVQAVNEQCYHAFWLRDASVMTHALDVSGLSVHAGEDLPFFLTWQDPVTGQFISRPGQLDGFGQALWAFGDHLRRTGDAGFGRLVYPSVQRAMAWFEGARAADPLRLMPTGDPRDNEFIAGHLAGDNFWAYAGVEMAVDMARRLGHGADAGRWVADLADFRQVLQARARAAAVRVGGYVPPALDVGGGQDWGNYWLAWPAQAFPVTDPLVTRTIAHARSEFREGLASYGEPTLLHAYLGYRVFETQLLRGEAAAVVRGLYDELAHTTSANASFETGIRPFGSRTVDTGTVPHGWWAAEYVTLLRNMLVREQGDRVVLMSALSPSWLAPGKVVEVRNAPTELGRVSFRLQAKRGGARLTWRSPLRSLSWPVPYGVRHVHAPGLRRGIITLHGRSGSLNVTWTLAGGSEPTFEKVAAALLKAYSHHHGGAATNGRNAVPTVSDSTLRS